MVKDALSHLIKVLLLFFIYFYAAKIGLTFDPVGGFATYVWFPTGISLAVLLIFGIKYWPGIFLGAFFANYTSDAPFLVSGGIALGNTLEAVIGSYLLKRYGFNVSLSEASDVIKLIFLAAIASSLVSASVGSTSLLLGNLVSPQAIWTTFGAWWIGNAVSDLIVAPLIFAWFGNSFKLGVSREKLFELTFLVFSTFFIGILIFRILPALIGQSTPHTYLVFPPLIWAAIRFNQVITTTIMFILSIIAVWATSMGYGFFAGENLSTSLYYLQSFMGITALTTLLLSSIVTDRREMEIKKDNFVSMVGHELKNPLSSMKVFAHLEHTRLKKMGDTENIKYVQKIDKGLDRLIHLVNDLLDVSRIQSDRFYLNKEPFLLDALLDEVVEDIQATTKKHKIVIKRKTRKKIVADRYRIEQVLHNLLSNAIKYSPLSKKIYLETQASKKKITIMVKDAGVGIAPENVKKIFSLFYRAQSSKVMPGLGIGLYVTQRIVKQHGGRMWVKSKKGKGSTFFVSLPI